MTSREEKKSRILEGFELRALGCPASRNTDCAIPAISLFQVSLRKPNEYSLKGKGKSIIWVWRYSSTIRDLGTGWS
jgi:hypothetical protein